MNRERLDLERASGSEEESSVTNRVEGDIIINRPIEEVFDFCADERNEPRYNPQMAHVEQTSSGPIGLGSQFRAEMRTMGRMVAMTIEWTAYERPSRLASSDPPLWYGYPRGSEIRASCWGHQDAVDMGPGTTRRTQVYGTDDHPDGPTPGADYLDRPEACNGSTGWFCHSCLSCVRPLWPRVPPR